MDDDGEIELVFGDSDGYDVAEGTRKRKVSYSRNVFFLSELVILHCNFKKNPLRGNSERIPTTIVVPHNYECSFKGELNLMNILSV